MPNQSNDEFQMSSKNERPLECGGCKKPIKYIYKEMVDHAITRTCMCNDCPMYHLKLHGQSTDRQGIVRWGEKDKGLCCGKCGTSMEAIRMGQPLGCSECYSIFEDLLTHELLMTEKVAPRMKPSIETKQSMPIHIGKSPHGETDYALSDRLTTLNEALNEALQKENYEQAAWLRDQIKAIMEKPNERENQTS